MLEAGKLNRRITIQRRAAGVDSRGQASGAWQDVATVWAMEMPRSAREFFAAGQYQPELSMAWRIRYRTDITADMRVVDDRGQPWEIVGPPVPSARREWLDVFGLQGVRDGR